MVTRDAQISPISR